MASQSEAGEESAIIIGILTVFQLLDIQMVLSI